MRKLTSKRRFKARFKLTRGVRVEDMPQIAEHRWSPEWAEWIERKLWIAQVAHAAVRRMEIIQ